METLLKKAVCANLPLGARVLNHTSFGTITDTDRICGKKIRNSKNSKKLGLDTVARIY